MIIYKITNKINNKIYVGYTEKMGIVRRFKKHIYDWKKGNYRSKLYSAFSKYGIDNFSIEIIEKCSSLEEMYAKEKFWITFLDTVNKGYNILEGGFAGGLVGESEKENYSKNMSQILQGRRLRPNRSSSSYIGVQKHRLFWNCCLKYNKKKYSKIFDSEREAALAYDKLALYFYGEKAKTNFSYRYSIEELEYFFHNFKIKNPPRRKYPGKYPNVIRDITHNKWRAIYREDGRVIKTIYRTSEEDAYSALQEFIKEYKKSRGINPRLN